MSVWLYSFKIFSQIGVILCLFGCIILAVKPKAIKLNKQFVGRDYEKQWLLDISKQKEASIIVLYGRRRIGKTELLEQTFCDRNILKFEGISDISPEEQIQKALEQLALYVEDSLVKRVRVNSWLDFFRLLSKYTTKGTWTIYFEELQWLANYNSEFIAELKHAWDNEFRHNQSLIVILCGSSPSFMIKAVLHSKALYNRSQYELKLNPFNIFEAKDFLAKKSDREVMDAYLSVGGIPEYLKFIKKKSSVFTSLCHHSFSAGGFFVSEYQRIFTSSLSENKYYQQIIEFVSKKRFVTRDEIIKYLKIKSGGTVSALLEDLVLCGFIDKYSPYHLGEGSTLVRYRVDDNYLHFYYKFIKPISNRIQEGEYNENPSSAIKTESYQKWLGFAFERFCIRNHKLIAKKLGFESVNYRYGSFFSRDSDKQDPNYQIDLLFDRDDKVITICEIKYLQTKVKTRVIEEFERKLDLFPNKSKKTIHKVLIAAEGADDVLISRAYFDSIITLTDLMQPS